MQPEDSALLTEITRRYNQEMVGQDSSDAQVPSMQDLVLEILDEAESCVPKFNSWSLRKSIARIKWRQNGATSVRRALAKRYGKAFNTFEAALAASEFVNRSLVNAYQDWMADQPQEERFPTFFGVDSSIGGRHVKTLLLLAMHARSVRIGTEILHLLRDGYHEGAAARSRTLYELTVKMMLICSDSGKNGWELAERYYVSSQLERYSKSELSSGSLSEVDAQMRDLAIDRWGSYIFKGQNNWAAPAVDGQLNGNVTFRQLEDAVEADELLHWYREGNHAVHVGAMNLIESTDFRKRYLHSCRGDVDLVRSGRIGQATSFCIEVGTIEAAKRITSDLGEWDWMLSTIEFYRKIEDANRQFLDVYKSRE